MFGFREIGNREPVDRTARRVCSEGIHFSVDPKYLASIRSDTPLPITTRRPHYDTVDLTGKVFGRLMVVGLFDSPRKIRWVVRCVCGSYELRRSRALRVSLPEKLMCSSCLSIEERKAGRGPWMASENGDRSWQ